MDLSLKPSRATVPLKHFFYPHPPANTSSVIACRQLSDSLIFVVVCDAAIAESTVPSIDGSG